MDVCLVVRRGGRRTCRRGLRLSAGSDLLRVDFVVLGKAMYVSGVAEYAASVRPRHLIYTPGNVAVVAIVGMVVYFMPAEERLGAVVVGEWCCPSAIPDVASM